MELLWAWAIPALAINKKAVLVTALAVGGVSALAGNINEAQGSNQEGCN